MAKTKKAGSKFITSSRARTATALFIHHKHSFKLRHHRHTNYPALAGLLVFTLAFCSVWTSFAAGADYTVNAIVPAPPLPVAATLDSPDDGSIFHDAVVTASGTCPSNSYVKLFNDHVFAGTSLCRSGGIWSVQTVLHEGANMLDAQDYNITDQAGPDSNTITVYYRKPVVSTPTTGQSTITPQKTTTKSGAKAITQPASEPLRLGADFMYRGFAAGEVSDWPISIEGGKPPYAVDVDWGDGHHDLKSITAAGMFNLQHTYDQAGSFQGSYQIQLKATDTADNYAILDLFTIITPNGTGVGASGLGTTGGIAPGQTVESVRNLYHRFWHAAAPTLAISGVAVAGFWIGEASKQGLLHAFRWPKLPLHHGK